MVRVFAAAAVRKSNEHAHNALLHSSPHTSVAALGVGLVVLAREERIAAVQPQAEAARRQVLLAVSEQREEGEHEQDLLRVRVRVWVWVRGKG